MTRTGLTSRILLTLTAFAASCAGLAAVSVPAGASIDPVTVPWVSQAPANSPSPRGGMPFVYDEAHGESVLFGGYNGSRLGDTWTWDGTNWTQRTPASAPSARSYAAMAYDAARGNVVLFGGYDGSHYNDTWIWDGTNWTQRSPAHSPSPRRWAAMTYDSVRDVVVLFDGVGGNADTWTWDGTDWTQRTPVHSPPSRDGGAMAFDPINSEVVLFGSDSSSTHGDTWTWDGTDWTQRSPAHAPTGRGFEEMAWDSSRSAVVLFGGKDWSTSTVFSDTWTWNGTDWSEDAPTASPSASGYGAMAYDAPRHQMVLFGGYENVGSAATWTRTYVPQNAVKAVVTVYDKQFDGTTAATVRDCTLETLSGVRIEDSEVACTVGAVAFDLPWTGSGLPVRATGITLTGSNAGAYDLVDPTATTTAEIFGRGFAFGSGRYATPASPPDARFAMRTAWIQGMPNVTGRLIWNSWRHFRFTGNVTSFMRSTCPETGLAVAGVTRCGEATGTGALLVWDPATGHWRYVGNDVQFVVTVGDGGPGHADFVAITLSNASVSAESSTVQRLLAGRITVH